MTSAVRADRHSAGSLPYALTWENVSYSVPVNKTEMRMLLNKVSGSIQPGSVVAIMGSSGAGKSTLLNVLAGRIGPGLLSGTILVNGVPRDPAYWTHVVGYVEQDDMMYEHLTVRETLQYSAELRLSRTVSPAEKLKRVDEVISQLGLKKCQDTIIGDSEVRGISGGERKRVSIGIEMVSSPKLLFLDEPTSGLDAFTSSYIIETVKEIAVKDQRTVLMTIHQPREYILSLFDQIILLSQGQVLFCGNLEDAVQHFANCGFMCPQRTNPADFFLDTITVDFRSDELKATSSARVKKLHESSLINEKLSTISPVMKFDAELRAAQQLEETWANSWPMEFAILFRRNVVDLKRDSATIGATIGQSVVNIIILGFVFLRLNMSYQGVQSRIGVLFMLCIQLTFGNVMPSIPVFIQQRAIIKRERAAGSYRASSAFMAKLSAQLPLVVAATLLLGLPVYWIIGLKATTAAYLTFLAALTLHAVIATIYGILISSGVSNVRVAQIIAPMTIVLYLIFGGLLVNLDSAPAVLRWLKWISIIHYTFSLLATNELTGESFECQTPSPSCSVTGEAILTSFSLHDFPNMYYSLLVNSFLGFFFMAIGFLLFQWKSRPLMRLR